MILRWLAVMALGGAVLAVGACSSDDEPADKGKEADCEAIIEACHTKDDGAQGELTTCHETAHETSEGTDYTYCKANKARCVALCDAAPVVATGGSGGAGGSGTGGHSHGGAGGEAAGGAGGDSHGGAGGAAGAAGTGGHSHGGAGGAAAGAGGA